MELNYNHGSASTSKSAFRRCASRGRHCRYVCLSYWSLLGRFFVLPTIQHRLPTYFRPLIILNLVPILSIMSHAHPSVPTSSPNFQLIFNNALKTYEKKTKKDLLAHPLAALLQACDSPSAVLLVLQEQVQELSRSRVSDERLTKWLDPTVNVLYAFSGALGEGVGLVRFISLTRLGFVLSYLSRRYSHQLRSSLRESASSS